MKKVLFFVLIIVCMLFLSSCKKEKTKVDYTIWTGEEFEDPHFGGIRQAVPVCIVWYKGLPRGHETAWRPYKSFSQTDVNDMREIILFLTRPEIKEPNRSLKTPDKLSLIFYNGCPETLTVREVYFEIKGQTFIGPVGKSKKLADVLLKRKQVRTLFYYPYTDMDPTRYFDDWERILKINEAAYEYAEKQRTEIEPNSQKQTLEMVF